MEKQYFIVVGGNHVGPLSKEELRQRGISSTTLVWCQGMPDWQQANTLGELSDLFNNPGQVPPVPGGNPSSAPDAGYFAMIGGNRIGPATPEQLAAQGLAADSPVWHEGFPDWMMASSLPEMMDAISRRNTYNINGGPQSQYPYTAPQGYPDYGVNPGVPTPHTNWLPWAIVGTVLGLGSCLGLIFGVLGIVNANQANSYYAQGNDMMGDNSNRSAKTWTIVSLVLGGLGIIGNISLFSTGLFNSLL